MGPLHRCDSLPAADQYCRFSKVTAVCLDKIMRDGVRHWQCASRCANLSWFGACRRRYYAAGTFSWEPRTASEQHGISTFPLTSGAALEAVSRICPLLFGEAWDAASLCPLTAGATSAKVALGKRRVATMETWRRATLFPLIRKFLDAIAISPPCIPAVLQGTESVPRTASGFLAAVIVAWRGTC